MKDTGAERRSEGPRCRRLRNFPAKDADTKRCLPQDSVTRALALIGAVHEHGPNDVAATLDRTSYRDLLELAVTLAAMVPDDYSAAELLAWNDSRYEPPEQAEGQRQLFPATRQLLPHGTHSAFNRHRTAGEEPCQACWHGERDYQRARARRRRAKDVA